MEVQEDQIFFLSLSP